MTKPRTPENAIMPHPRAIQTIQMMASATPGYAGPAYNSSYVPTVVQADAPQYSKDALRPEDQALVDYWIARHYRKSGPPTADELAADFVGKFIGAAPKSQRTITVSKVWPSWMIDTLAVSWSKFRAQNGFNDSQLFKEHPGGECFILQERPVFGTIEVDYKTERTELLFEQATYLAEKETSGLIVKMNFTGGYGSPSLEIMCHEKARDSAQRFLDAFAKVVEQNNIYRGKHLNVVSGRIKFTKIEPASFDHIIMNKRVIDLVRSNTVDLMSRRDQLKRYNIGTSHSTILAGRPGTGKTLLCRAVATALGSSVTTWLVTAKAFYGAYDVTSFYEMVRAFGPAFVLFEDIDMVGRERSPNSTNEVLGELLNQMSGTMANDEILTIASTNDLSALDAALADRPERIGTKIEVPLPGTTERRQMLELFASKFNSKIELDSGAWSSILGGTEGLTGDYMRAVVRLAVRNTISKSKAEASAVLLVREQELTDALAEILRSKSVGQRPQLAPVTSGTVTLGPEHQQNLSWQYSQSPASVKKNTNKD
jgi:hypothetical protein